MGRGRMEAGQSLVLVALVLPVLVILVMSSTELATRLLQRAEVEDALRHASRSAIQTFDYQPFAEATTQTRPEAMIAIATGVFQTNLGGVHGLKTSAAATAASVQWQPLPSGSASCQAPDGTAVAITGPALCATVLVRLRGLVGWNEWQSTVFVIETLDHVR